MSDSHELVVVPHTHWDREWYLPFQRFRLQLVALLDELLDRMEADPRHRFTLDGQMAAVDDYLEVRPEARERMTALVKSGRLAIGPWDILMDEFLCSGEQIVRNLERGIRRSGELGGTMPVGYLPDMFGHIAQMPQILRGAGLDHACVFRGVPGAVTSDTFAWVSPDGTAVRTRYLPAGGYGNAAGLLADRGTVAERLRELHERMSAWTLPESGPLLGMYGSDHTAPATTPPICWPRRARRRASECGWPPWRRSSRGCPQVPTACRWCTASSAATPARTSCPASTPSARS